MNILFGSYNDQIQILSQFLNCDCCRLKISIIRVYYIKYLFLQFQHTSVFKLNSRRIQPSSTRNIVIIMIGLTFLTNLV